MNNQEEYASVLANLQDNPPAFLTPDEITIVQETANELSRLSDRLSSIGMAASRRHGIASVLRRDIQRGDNSRLAALAAISLGIHPEVFPDINFQPTLREIDGDIGKKGPMVWVEMCQASESLKNMSERISRMCNTEPPQTIFALRDLSRLISHQSDGGSIHGRTDIQDGDNHEACIPTESHG